MTETPIFGEPETITIAELQAGDFVLEILPAFGVAGAKPMSAIREISEAAEGRWQSRQQARPRARIHRAALASRRMLFQDRSLAALDVPVDHEAIVRRPAGRVSLLPLEEAIDQLETAFLGACEDTEADQPGAVDAGGWVELARAIADLAGAEISAEAKAEFFRRNGIEAAAR
jgi:hypothetical protein